MKHLIPILILAALPMAAQITSVPQSGGSSAPVKRTIAIAVGDPAGTALSTGVLGYLVVPAACTIQSWDIVVDAGTATVDIWKVATGTAKPTVANTITASAKPASPQRHPDLGRHSQPSGHDVQRLSGAGAL